MPRTDSRKANQRRRFEKQRKENRERILAIRAQAPAGTAPAAATN